MPFNRNQYLESAFYDAYRIKCEIEKTEILDAQGNYNQVIVKFKDKCGNIYGLIENYNAGSDNSTKNVVFEDAKGNEIGAGSSSAILKGS